MTEKIARRGVITPHSYEADILEQVTVGEIMKPNGLILKEAYTVSEARSVLHSLNKCPDYFIITKHGEFTGVVSASSLLDNSQDPNSSLRTLVKRVDVFVTPDQSLRTATEMMAREKAYVLVIHAANDNRILGTVSYRDVIEAVDGGDDQVIKYRSISLRRNGLKILVRGKNLLRRKRN